MLPKTMISGLRKLQYVVAYIENADNNFNINFRQAVKIHSGIGCLQALQKLIKIEASSAVLIAKLGSLVLLRRLEIFKLKRENGIVLCTVLKEMSHLQSLDICASSEDEVLELQSMSSLSPFPRKLRFSGRLEKLPEWIPKLKSITRISLIWSRLMDNPLKVLQALPILVELWLYDGYIGEQLRIERGGFQKLKNLGLQSLTGLNRLMIDEGALPLLDQLDIGPCPDSFLVTGIHHLKGLKIVDFFDMPTKFVLSLQPNEGPDFGQVQHIPSVTFLRVCGVYYKSYKLGDSKLLERLQS